MASRLAVILGCGVLLVCAARPAACEEPQTRNGHAYLALVDQYQRGEFDAAVAAFMLWRPEEVRAVVPGELVELMSLRRAHAVLMLHVEALLKGGSSRELMPAVRRALHRLLGKRDTGDLEFLTLARVVVGSYLLWRGEPRLAWQVIEPTDDPRLELLDGSISEYAAAHGVGGRQLIDRPTALRRAEARYRQALAAAPDLDEARLRLGRVLGVMGRSADARVELERVYRDAQHSYVKYLAALFLGDLDERAERFDKAATWYRLACREYPEAQTARLAIGHLLESTGKTDEGWAEVRRIFAVPEHPGTPARDPWWEYRNGQIWLFGAMVETLRGVVVR